VARTYSLEERRRLAAEGNELPDGSYPMPDCEAVDDAVHAYGRAPESHRHQVAALIRKRNQELSCNIHLEELEHE
jgi:hypothetical protein